MSYTGFRTPFCLCIWKQATVFCNKWIRPTFSSHTCFSCWNTAWQAQLALLGPFSRRQMQRFSSSSSFQSCTYMLLRLYKCRISDGFSTILRQISDRYVYITWLHDPYQFSPRRNGHCNGFHVDQNCSRVASPVIMFQAELEFAQFRNWSAQSGYS